MHDPFFFNSEHSEMNTPFQKTQPERHIHNSLVGVDLILSTEMLFPHSAMCYY